MRTFDEISRAISLKKISPIYLLMGDESFFIDELTRCLIDNVVSEGFKDFNESIFYGSESNVRDIILACKRFPMMSDKQLIVVREAQKLKNIEDLVNYVRQPLSTTVLVLAYKYGTLDKRKQLYKEIQHQGEIFESKKIQDYKLSEYITSIIKSKNLRIDQKSAQILADFLGNDLSKLHNEIEKLQIILKSQHSDTITSEVIETNIGISKDFNNFELLKAVIQKDFQKCILIANYFEENAKNNPVNLTLGILFNYFSNLMICFWSKDKSEVGLANELSLKSSFMARDYVVGCKQFNAWKTMEIISLLRVYDAKSKGFDNSSTSSGNLLKELLFKIIY